MAAEPIELYPVIAQIAAAFAGFGSLATGLGSRRGGDDARVDAFRLGQMLFASLNRDVAGLAARGVPRSQLRNALGGWRAGNRRGHCAGDLYPAVATECAQNPGRRGFQHRCRNREHDFRHDGSHRLRALRIRRPERTRRGPFSRWHGGSAELLDCDVLTSHRLNATAAQQGRIGRGLTAVIP